MPTTRRRTALAVAALCTSTLAATLTTALTPTAAHAAPAIQKLTPRGLQIGATTRLTIEGTDLAGGQVLLGAPLSAQQIAPGSTPGRLLVDVTLADHLEPGLYRLHVHHGGGISAAATVSVDRLPPRPLGQPIDGLPAALEGDLTGGAVRNVEFPGKQGERTVIEVEARRLGSKLRPVLRLVDAQGGQVAWSSGIDSIGGDARIDCRLPRDGTYTIELHDLLRRGAAPGHFRLKVGQLTYVDLVHPLAAAAGTTARLLPVRSSLDPAQPLERPIAGPPGWTLLEWRQFPVASGGRPALLVSPHAEYAHLPADGPSPEATEVPPPPIGINGRLARQTEQVYRLPVTPGAHLRFDVLAARIGSPLDGVLTIRNPQGGQLATNDDRGELVDPGLDFKVPANVKQLQVALGDVAGRRGDDFVYRIDVRPIGAPDFRLTAAAGPVTVPAAGRSHLTLDVERKNYDGPIDVELVGLPAGVTAAPVRIGAGATRALAALEGAAGPPLAGWIELVARGEPSHLVRRGTFGPAVEPSSWAAQRAPLAVTGAQPIGVSWQPADGANELVIGGPLAAHVQLDRRAAADGKPTAGNVRLQLVTNQRVPKKKVKQKGKEVEVDDPARALRLEGTPMLAGDATEVDVKLLVPADLPAGDYDLAIRAELLSADGKRVQATGLSPVVRRTAVPPPEAAKPAEKLEDPEKAAKPAEAE